MTELEGAVLGVVWSRGSLTAYAVRKRFLASLTTGWSVSEGAIYPAIKRLSRAGLLFEEQPSGRGGRKLNITDAGKNALRDWVAGIDDAMGGATVDPIRTRVNYLTVLTRSERRSYLNKAVASTQAALERSKSYEIDPIARDQWVLVAAHRGAVYELEARLRWLKELRDSAV